MDLLNRNKCLHLFECRHVLSKTIQANDLNYSFSSPLCSSVTTFLLSDTIDTIRIDPTCTQRRQALSRNWIHLIFPPITHPSCFRKLLCHLSLYAIYIDGNRKASWKLLFLWITLYSADVT